MVKINREQIVEALDCWIKNFDGKVTDFKTLCEALSLLKELTQKLELANLEIECKERICESYMLQYGTVADKELRLKKERADTVRKMRKRLKAKKFTHKNLGELVYVEDIDQIAKEMLEAKP